MKVYIFISWIILLSVTINAQTKNFIDQPYLETSGIVDTLVVPDKIYLSIVIKEKDLNGKETIDELEQKMMAELRILRINIEHQLFLNGLSSNFNHYIIKKSKIFKTKSYSLLLNNGYDAGKVIIALANIKISNISIERIEYSRIDELKLALKERAIIQAQKNARILTKALNQTLGPAIHIEDFIHKNNNIINDLQGHYAGGNNNRYKSEIANKYEHLDFNVRKLKFSCQVNVKFKLELE